MKLTKYIIAVFIGLVTLHLCTFEVQAYEPNPPYDIAVYDYLYEQLMAFNPEIDMSSMKVLLNSSGNEDAARSEARLIYSGCRMEHEDAFAAEECEEKVYREGSNFYLEGYSIKYGDYDMDAFYKEVDRALALIKPEMTDYAKALILHDYIISYCCYDFDTDSKGNSIEPNPHVRSAYGVLVDGVGICYSYTMAYKYLLKQVGIECYTVRSNKENHAWAYVILDGEGYNIDLVVDDPSYDALGLVWHDTFCMSDNKENEIVASDISDMKVYVYDCPTDLRATDTRYEDLELSRIERRIFEYNGMYYYIINRSIQNVGTCIMLCEVSPDRLGKRGNTLIQNTAGFENNGFSCIVKIENDRIYYTVPYGIDSCYIDGTDIRDEYRIEPRGEGSITGAVLEKDGRIKYVYSTSEFTGDIQEYSYMTDDDKVYFEPEPEISDQEESIDENEEGQSPKIVISKETNSEDIPEKDTSEEDNGSNVLLPIIVFIVAGLLLVLILVIVIKSRKRNAYR